MGGAWSCCLPCAGGGGGGGGAAVSVATPEAKKGSIGHKYQQQHQPSQPQQQHPQQKEQQQQPKLPVVLAKELAPVSILDEDLDEIDEKVVEQIRPEKEDFSKEGGTQHRLSPRLHDIEEEDDEDGRNTKERSVNHYFLVTGADSDGPFGPTCIAPHKRCWFRGFLVWGWNSKRGNRFFVYFGWFSYLRVIATFQAETNMLVSESI